LRQGRARGKFARMTQTLVRQMPLRSLAAACAALALAGCADVMKLLQTTEFQQPSLTFVRATPKALALDTVSLDVTYRIDNPNAVGLSLAKANCALALEGKTVASASPDASFKVPASGAGEITFPTTVHLPELVGGLQAALEKKVLHWKASGEVGVNTPIGIVSLPLSAEGDLPVPQLPKVSLGTPRVSMEGFTRLRLILPIGVENPNGFALPLGAVGGALTFAGAQVGQVSADGKGEAVAAGAKKTVEVAVGVDLLSAGAAVASAVSAGEADFTLDGSLQTGAATLPVKLSQHLSLGK
jgi:LEA14-like dessication related protein